MKVLINNHFFSKFICELHINANVFVRATYALFCRQVRGKNGVRAGKNTPQYRQMLKERLSE